MLEQRTGGLLVHRTKASDLRMAAAMEHLVETPGKHAITTEGHPDWLRTTVACKLEPGQKLRVVKLAAYGWSSHRSLPAVRDQVGGALASARLDGWEGLVEAQRDYLDAFWDHSDVQVEGDPEVQQAVRFGLFHTLQAGARAEQRPIGSKGLTGPGYDGHTFWDAETFVLPALTYTQPSAAADVLRWRHSTLDLARERAQTLGLQGAAFPWRTIRGQECSAYWPAGTAGFHIGADIADAVRRYVQATGDVRLRAGGRPGAAGRDRPAVAVAGPPRPARALPHRRRDRPGRVHRRGGRQHLHEPDGAAEHVHRRRGREAPPGHGPQAGRGRRGGGVLAGRGGGRAHPVRPGAGRAPAVAGLHPAAGVGLREHAAGGVPAAAELPVLRPVPQAGGQAGRPGHGDVRARRRVHAGREGAQLRLLRRPYGAGLVAVGVHPGGHGRRGGLPGAGPRLPGRSRPDGPARPAPERPGRRARGVAGRLLDRAGRRPGRHAGLQRSAVVRAAAAQPDQQAWSSRCSGGGCGCG